MPACFFGLRAKAFIWEFDMALKNVKIEIDSLVEDLDDSGLVSDSSRTSATAEGVMTTDEKETVISYSETAENERTDSVISLRSGSVSVKRTGALTCDFLFSEGETTSTLYSVGPYSFDAEIYTRKIRSSIDASGGEITLIYDMTLGGAKKKTKMKIRVSEK